jgi:hypothetical protein
MNIMSIKYICQVKGEIPSFSSAQLYTLRKPQPKVLSEVVCATPSLSGLTVRLKWERLRESDNFYKLKADR